MENIYAYYPILFALIGVVITCMPYRDKMFVYAVCTCCIFIITLDFITSNDSMSRGMFFTSAMVLALCMIATNVMNQKIDKKKHLSKNEQDQAAYDADDNWYAIEYKYTVIGGCMRSHARNHIFCNIFTQDNLPGEYKNHPFTDGETDPDLRYIELILKTGGESRIHRSLLFKNTSPIIREFAHEKGVTSFVIRFVVCKRSILMKAIDDNPNSIILCGDRSTGHLTVYATSDDNVEEVEDWKTLCSYSFDPLWILISNTDDSITGEIQVHNPICPPAVFSNIFRIVTKYDPNYVCHYY